VWAQSEANILNPAVNTWQVVDVLAGIRTAAVIAINLPGFTLGPFHFKISVRIQVPHTPLNGSEGFQIGLIRERQSLLAATAVSGVGLPLPNTTQQADWLWNEWFPATDIDLVGTTLPGPISLKAEIHAKSMRKLSEMDDTVGLICVPTGGCTLTGFSYVGRTLVRLP